tara:strand:+ start:1133 stop:1963 length:831 start_codon:yes stop_codon:yes gene_type:complete
MKKILITGHKGFIGKNLYTFLLKKKFKVKGFDLLSNKKFPIIKNFDWVIHLGANSSTTETNVEKIFKQNYEYSKMILNQCIKHNVNLQYASSASVYDIKKGFEETSKCYPKSPYSWSKYLFDKYVERANYNIIVQGFRYFNVFGKNEKDKKDQASPVYKFIKQAIIKKKIKLFYNSDQYLRDFVCVDDVCKVHLQMLSQDTSGLFNVGRGNTLSFQKIAESVSKKFSCKIEYIQMPKKIENHYQKYTKANIKKIKKYVKIKWIDPIKYINKLTKVN